VDCDQAHLPNDGFAALSFEADRLFAADWFQHFLELLPDNVFRAKGMLGVT
jgi:G3E family GTPase